MRYRRLDADGDMVFGAGGSDFLRDAPDAVAQAVRTRLGLWTGEWFLDLAEGMDWRGQVLGSDTAGLHDMAVRARILGTPGMAALASYESERNGETRALQITATLDTVYGVARLGEVGVGAASAPPVFVAASALGNILTGGDGEELTGVPTDGNDLLTGVPT